MKLRKVKIFLVEDDAFFGEMLKFHLSHNSEYEVFLYKNSKECLFNLYLNPDIICVDFGLPDMNGDVLLKKIKNFNSKIPVIIISGQENIEVAVDFLKCGAYDYITKNEHTKDFLWSTITKIKENILLKNEILSLKNEPHNKNNINNPIIGESTIMKDIYQKIDKVSKVKINVFITGETGTGKEAIAKAIHYKSDRKNSPFVAVNMAAIPNELMESEFFGHEKGAFTGALNKSIGKFEQANKGTLFLDEIGDLDINLQSKLLRALQENEIIRVGGIGEIKFDTRIIIATHKNLKEEVEKGNFREDLYYRVIGFPIALPPLRERSEDILLLANHFISLFCLENDIERKILTQEAENKLMKYVFPGNVRELKYLMDIACVVSDTNEICEEDISILYNSIDNKAKRPSNEEKTLKEYTTEIILYYLNEKKYDIQKTARTLNIGKSTIYKVLSTMKVN